MTESTPVCPFLEQADPRCAAHLSLQRLDDALGRCADHFEQCPIYREKLLADASRRREFREHLRAAG